MGIITPQAPTTISRLKILEPITFPTAISLLPDSDAEMLTASSGALVPKATMVRPIITVGTRRSLATEELPSTKKSAPLINNKNPASNNTYIIILTFSLLSLWYLFYLLIPESALFCKKAKKIEAFTVPAAVQ